MTCCQSCGVEAPTKYVEFYQNIGALIMRFSKSIKGNLCKNCINKHFWPLTLTTLFIGWLGVVSLIITPFILLNNIIRYLLALSLPAPDPFAVAPRLTDDVVAKLQPHTDDLIQRLQGGATLEQAAPIVATNAGVTPGQVALYFQALVRASQQKK